MTRICEYTFSKQSMIDLTLALLVTCVPCLLLAGIVGIVGSRWVNPDMQAAECADRLAQEQRG